MPEQPGFSIAAHDRTPSALKRSEPGAVLPAPSYFGWGTGCVPDPASDLPGCAVVPPVWPLRSFPTAAPSCPRNVLRMWLCCMDRQEGHNSPSPTEFMRC
jgi:hypothetical protein